MNTKVILRIYLEFNQFDNVFSLLDKIRDDKISLTDVKNDQENLKSDLNEIKKGSKKHRSKEKKKTLCTILKCFTMQETRLLNFMMIILQWCLKQKLKQLKEQDLKY